MLGAGRGYLGGCLVLAFFLFRHALHGDHRFGLFQSNQADALGIAPDGGDSVHRHADKFPVGGDKHQIFVIRHEAKPNHLAVALGGFNGDNALSAAVLGRIIVGRSALPVALLANRKQGRGQIPRHRCHAHNHVVGAT